MLFWAVFASILYVIMRLCTGLFEGFGRNALDTSILGILRNVFVYVMPFICREIVRAALLKDCRAGKKYTKVLGSVSCVVLAFAEVNVVQMMRSLHPPFGLFEQLGGILMPAIVVSAMLTFTALYGGFLPGVIYRAATQTIFFVLPIIPDNSWLTTSLLGSLIPFVIIIILDYSIGMSNHTMTRRDVNNEKPSEWISLFAVLTVFVLFITGVLPIYPVAVATGSMEPNIMVGDMVIVNKTEKARARLSEGDIIQFSHDGYTVIHRIIEVGDDHGDTYYITKGDNNNAPDKDRVAPETVIGRVSFRVPYAGWLTLWIHSEKVEDDAENVDVETGGNNPWRQ